MNIVIDRFGGLMPVLDPTRLPPYGAQAAQDVKLHHGVLSTWRAPASLDPPVAVSEATQAILFDEGSGDWITWTTDVDAHLGPVEDLSGARRYYLTGDGVPKKFDSAGGYAGVLNMGVPNPTAAASASGGTGALTRAYVYTNVSVFSGIEEESGPSPATTITNWASGNTISLTGMSAVPGAGYNVTKRRLYRSSGSAYLFVKEFTGTSTTENVTDANLGGGLSTLTFEEPPTTLAGLTPLPNGFFAGFVGNQLYFSEPYQPHAWPGAYCLTTPENIVALRAVSQGLYVLTEGMPYVCTGSHPSAMTMERCQEYAPCLAKRSVASDGIGVIYASYNGLSYLRGTSVETLTRAMFTQEEWSGYAPASMMGVFYDGRYLFWFDTGTEAGGFVLDRAVDIAPLASSRYDVGAAAIRADTGGLYWAIDGEIKLSDSDAVNRAPFDWTSKLFLMPKPLNFGFLQVLIDPEDSTLFEEALAAAAANAALWASGGYIAGWNDIEYNQWEFNGSEMVSAPSVDTQSTTVRVYVGEDTLVATFGFQTSGLRRLPAGFKSDRWSVAVSGNQRVRRVALATSAAEIAAT